MRPAFNSFEDMCNLVTSASMAHCLSEHVDVFIAEKFLSATDGAVCVSDSWNKFSVIYIGDVFLCARRSAMEVNVTVDILRHSSGLPASAFSV